MRNSAVISPLKCVCWRLGLLFAAGIFFLQPCYAQFTITSEIANGDFETGDFSGWSSRGAVKVTTLTDYGVQPYHLMYEAWISNEKIPDRLDKPLTDLALEEYLGILHGSFDALGNGNAYKGSLITQTFAANAGDMLRVHWDFLSAEQQAPAGNRQNDFAFLFLKLQDSQQSPKLVTLANQSSTFFQTDIPTRDNLIFETRYQTTTLTLPSSGTYTLGLGVFDVGDDIGQSDLLVDDIELVPVPEPLAWSIAAGAGLTLWTIARRFNRASRQPK